MDSVWVMLTVVAVLVDRAIIHTTHAKYYQDKVKRKPDPMSLSELENREEAAGMQVRMAVNKILPSLTIWSILIR